MHDVITLIDPRHGSYIRPATFMGKVPWPTHDNIAGSV